MDLQVFGPRNPNGFTNSCLKWFYRSHCDNDILFMLPNRRISTNAVQPWVPEAEKQPHFSWLSTIPDRRLEPAGGWSFFQETSDRTRGKGLKLHKGQFRFRKNFFTETVVNHWIRLSRAVVGSPFLGIFNWCVDVALRAVVQQWAWQCWVDGWSWWSWRSYNGCMIPCILENFPVQFRV